MRSSWLETDSDTTFLCHIVQTLGCLCVCCVCSGAWCGLEMIECSSSIPQSTFLCGRDRESWLIETSVISSRTHPTRERRPHLQVCLSSACLSTCLCPHLSDCPFTRLSSLYNCGLCLFVTDSNSSCQSSDLHDNDDNQDDELKHKPKSNRWV